MRLLYLIIVAIGINGSAFAEEEVTKENLNCLALTIYFEARNQPRMGKFAVADAVLNRVEDSYFPDTICSVVKQGSFNAKRPRACQFSWYCDGKPDIPTDTKSWEDAYRIAMWIAWFGMHRGITNGAKYYHADYVSPKWRHNLELTLVVANHIYYRE